MSRETLFVEGSFGDKKVSLNYVPSKVPSRQVLILFHGVHGCASLQEGNKYAVLANMLSSLDISIYLTETSRIRHDRETFGENRDQWAIAAFSGKTYAMDLFDACSAFQFVERRHPEAEIYLWGFSLGGLHSVMIAGDGYISMLQGSNMHAPLLQKKPSGLILSGSGDGIRVDKAKEAFKLPILDTVGSQQKLLHSASHIDRGWAVCFYGDEDLTFSERACRRLCGAIAVRDKEFIIIPGADHSFRKLYGIPSIKPLQMMTSHIAKRFSTPYQFPHGQGK
ncbi:MAG TPA: alpha/beta hydrolase [Aminobacterium sp.]|jgi:alpha-beta hydrolase superfamily lysophospholipase|uniref:alpha/beta hydrolase n=1 Tax=Aminobacterium TaxID=81466 RepID=UPI000EE3EFB7|nr:alpha/beta hydrolase [Aminobacterium sp. UBA4834]HCA41194.1 alpha/beta hydrolase [Aminobacterium sp.]